MAKKKRAPVGQGRGGSSTPAKTADSPSPENRLKDLINLVLEAAQAKGWDAEVAAEDKNGHKYATVAVSRTTPGTHTEVTGTFEILCDKKIRIAPHSTSFHSYGLKDLNEAVSNELDKLPWVKKVDDKSPRKTTDVELVERLLRRFHRAIRHLKHRHAGRPPLIVQDEYDVQDVLHVFLRGLFDDVRPEEYAPSYAGGASRMDFLLKSEQIVIETKMASASLRDKQIGEQLMIDIQRYRSHPDCKRLICFVYDPEGFIKNPSGLEADLTRTHDSMEVKVIVLSN